MNDHEFVADVVAEMKVRKPPLHALAARIAAAHQREMAGLRQDNLVLRERLILARGQVDALFEAIKVGKEVDALIVELDDDHNRAEAAEAALGEARELLKFARDEFAGLPRSLGYDFTHRAKLDDYLARTNKEPTP